MEQFTSRSPVNMVADLNRNRKFSVGNSAEQFMGSASPNIDRETGLPIAGKYLNGQEQDAAPAPGALPEEEQEEQPGGGQSGQPGQRIAGQGQG